MPRVCTICSHAAREQLDKLLVGKQCALSRVSRDYGVGRDALRRHAEAHISATLAKAHGATEAARGGDLFGQAREQQARATALYHAAKKMQRRAERDRNLELGFKAIASVARVLRETGASIELLAKVQLATGRVLTEAEADAMLNQIEDVIRRNVTDPQVLGAIAAELRLLSSARTVTAMEVL